MPLASDKMFSDAVRACSALREVRLVGYLVRMRRAAGISAGMISR